ncbi:MAG: hypothetical protein JO269_01660 [Burkholderiaceae bacterium]|nr:hypothetical protein [Burkholderiaceae bacterium]
MNMTKQKNFTSVLQGAGGRALQWRVLLLWVAALWIPTALLALPVWRLLAVQFDHSIYAAELAQRLDLNSVNDLMVVFSQNGLALAEAGIAALLATLLLSPLLSGALIAAARATEIRTLGQLIQAGVADYGRMLRMLLWAVVPLAVAGGLGAAAMQGAKHYAETAVLQANADWANYAATTLLFVLLLLAHATVDAGRAQLAADSRRRSAVKAWWMGCQMAWRRPSMVFGLYMAFSALGLMLMAVLGYLRINVPHAGAPGLLFALLLAQLIAAVSGWMRAARLFAMIDLARG